jgi:hypothetical protein
MDKNAAHVSCAIGYRVTDSPNEFWEVTVPTFVPTGIVSFPRKAAGQNQRFRVESNDTER